MYGGYAGRAPPSELQAQERRRLGNHLLGRQDMTAKPRCIIVTGRPGSGKTTLSKMLGSKLWMPVISRDEIKEGYVNTLGVKHDQLPPTTNGLVTDLFFEIVGRYLTGMVSIVMEAAFQHRVWEARIPRITEMAAPFMVICSIDAQIAAQRHLRRGLEEPQREHYHGDRRVAIYRETGTMGPPGEYAAPELAIPTLHVTTEAEYNPTLDEIAQRVQRL